MRKADVTCAPPLNVSKLTVRSILLRFSTGIAVAGGDGGKVAGGDGKSNRWQKCRTVVVTDSNHACKLAPLGSALLPRQAGEMTKGWRSKPPHHTSVQLVLVLPDLTSALDFCKVNP